MIVNKPSVSEDGDAVFAVVDGGRNDEAAKSLADNLVSTLQSELAHPYTHSDYMKYTMLVAHRYVGNWVSVVQSELAYAYTYSDYMKYTMLVVHRYVDN